MPASIADPERLVWQVSDTAARATPRSTPPSVPDIPLAVSASPRRRSRWVRIPSPHRDSLVVAACVWSVDVREGTGDGTAIVIMD